MRAERRLLRAGEFLVRFATLWLPARVRSERYREWAAELPAILRDPGLGPGWRRAAGMLGFALDIIRGTAMRPVQARYHGAHRGSDRPAAIRSARWLLFSVVMLTGLLAFLSLPLLLIYLVSWGAGVGLWPATGVSFMIVLASVFLPRRIRAASVLLWVSWQIYLIAASPSWWPAGSPVLLRISSFAFGVVAWSWMFEIGSGRLRRWLRLQKN